MTLRVLRSTCPYDCPDACGLVVDVRGDEVVAVRGDPEHGFTRGSLCPKVHHYERTVHAPGRIRTPLVRVGNKGEAQFRPSTWQEATALIADRWSAIVRAHGGEALLPVTYAGTMGLVQRNATHALFHKLGASRLDRGICTPAQDEGWHEVMGQSPGSEPEHVVDSDLVVLWGTNALATNVHFLQLVKQARSRGAHVVLIDTWRQPTAALVDEVLLVRPGTDGALALALLRVLLDEGRIDRRFIDDNVDGFFAFADAARADDAFAPAAVAERAGVRVDDVIGLARRIGAARAPFVRVGGGPFRTGNGGATMRAIVAVVAAVGAFARHGGGLLASTGTAAAFDLRPIWREDLLPSTTPAPRTISLNQLGAALTTLTPPVRGIFVSHCNPAAVCPDQNAVVRGLLREDLFTVVHERFMTDTARYADVVLPAPTMLETHDLYRSYGQFYLQRTRPAIAPLHDSRSNWDTARALAAALGFTDDVFKKTADQLIDELLDAPSPWRTGLDRTALDEGRAVRLTPPRDRWLTASGKIELRPTSRAGARPIWLPAHADNDDAARFPLRLVPAPSLFRLNSSFSERDDLNRKSARPTLRLHPSEAQRRGLVDGAAVVAHNALGETRLTLAITDDVPPGAAVVEGVHTRVEAGGPTINALMSQRLTDVGNGSTFSDNRIDVRAG